tara:strand:+ start:20481 stop:21104 length:624 start_codon:yes stop_codon:yes gene_type:complete
MKVTKRQLRRIIEEARYTPSFKRQIMQGHEDRELMDQYSDIDDYFDGGYDEEDREWIVHSELSGRFEPSGIRDPSELGKIKAYINVNGQAAGQHYGSQMAASMMETKMKITRRQLKRIIRESMGELHQSRRFQTLMAWGEGYGLSPEFDNEGQLTFYLDGDSQQEAVAEAEQMGLSIEVPDAYGGYGQQDDATVVVYTGAYDSNWVE